MQLFEVCHRIIRSLSCANILVGGGSADPNKNLQLAAVLKRAKEQDIPKENIEKALAKVRVPYGYSVTCNPLTERPN